MRPHITKECLKMFYSNSYILFTRLKFPQIVDVSPDEGSLWYDPAQWFDAEQWIDGELTY